MAQSCATAVVWAALIAVVALVVFANGSRAPFILDDRTAIESEGRLTNPSACFSSMLSEEPQTALAGRPVSCLSFALNRQLHGHSVFGYQAFNIALHALNGILVMLLARQILARTKIRGIAESVGALSLAIALLFVVHPLQTEAATYIVHAFARTRSFMPGWRGT